MNKNDSKMEAHLHAAVREDAIFLMETGLSFDQAASRLGLTVKGLEKKMGRAGCDRYGNPKQQAGAGEEAGGGEVLPLRDADEGGGLAPSPFEIGA